MASADASSRAAVTLPAGPHLELGDTMGRYGMEESETGYSI